MRENPMPVGNPTYFEGNILEYNFLSNPASLTGELDQEESNYKNDRPFGFFEVEIITPDDILNPILQTKLNGRGRGSRTIAPIGK
jgi:hypothetical protein